MITLTIPAKFWFDHSDRDCVLDPEFSTWQPASDPIHGVVVSLSQADVYELLSDAEHYAQTSDYSIALRYSASETVHAIHAQVDDEEIHRCEYAYAMHAQHERKIEQ